MVTRRDKEFLREVGLVIRMLEVGYTNKEIEIRMNKTPEEVKDLVECARVTKGI